VLFELTAIKLVGGDRTIERAIQLEICFS
jgi:hypothetical protein